MRELLYAYDAAIVAHSLADIQQIVGCSEAAAVKFGLSINIKKTALLQQLPPGKAFGNTQVLISKRPLLVTTKFT